MTRTWKTNVIDAGLCVAILEEDEIVVADLEVRTLAVADLIGHAWAWNEPTDEEPTDVS